MTAVNDAPANVSAIAAPTTINEAGSVTLTGSFTDPDIGDTHAVTITWGKGRSDGNLGAGVFAFSVRTPTPMTTRPARLRTVTR